MSNFTKPTLAAMILFSCAIASANTDREEFEMNLRFGADDAGMLRACSRHGDHKRYLLASKNMEVALLKFVRRSDLLESNYPEIQAGKVWVSTIINMDYLEALQSKESLAQVLEACEKSHESSLKFISKLDRSFVEKKKSRR